MKARRFLVGTATVIACAGMAVGLSGCTVARNGLGTHVNACAHVLPEARGAIGKSGVFGGVGLLPARDLGQAVSKMLRRHVSPPPALAALRREDECMVVFRGHFVPSEIAQAWAPTAGPYEAALVVVRPSDDEVVVTLLVRRLPRSIAFTHRGAFHA